MDETTDLIRSPAGRVLIGCAENLQQGTEGAGGLDDHRPSFALLGVKSAMRLMDSPDRKAHDDIGVHNLRHRHDTRVTTAASPNPREDKRRDGLCQSHLHFHENRLTHQQSIRY